MKSQPSWLFELRGEDEAIDRDDLAGAAIAEPFLHEGGETGADAGGIDDDAIGVPDVASEVGEFVAELGEAGADPDPAIDDAEDVG